MANLFHRGIEAARSPTIARRVIKTDDEQVVALLDLFHDSRASLVAGHLSIDRRSCGCGSRSSRSRDRADIFFLDTARMDCKFERHLRIAGRLLELGGFTLDSQLKDGRHDAPSAGKQ